MDLLGLMVISFEAGLCMRHVDRRQPIARWTAVALLGVAGGLSIADEFWLSAYFNMLACLIVMSAMLAKHKWLKRQEPGRRS